MSAEPTQRPPAPEFLAAYHALLARWGVPVESVLVETPYGTTHVNVCGPPDGAPMVLFHGGGATAADWFANAAELARTHRLYAIDRIGEPGLSVSGGKQLRMQADLFGWVDAVLDGLGLKSATLCGHSYGAWIALSYALHASGRVDRLVLLDPTQCFAGFRVGYLLRALPLLLRPSATTASAFTAWETRGAAIDPDFRELALLAAEFPRGRMVTGGRPSAARLRGLAVPTLAVFAELSRAHDPRRAAAAADAALPDVRTVVLPGVSHHGMPFVEAEALNRAIVEFTATGAKPG